MKRGAAASRCSRNTRSSRRARPGDDRDTAAPLSENGKAIDSILCAVSISPFETGTFAHSHEASTDNVLAIFALGSSRSLGQQVARHLHAELSPHEEREFEDANTRPVHWSMFAIATSTSFMRCMARRAGRARTSSVAAVLYRSAQGCRRRSCYGGGSYLCYARKDVRQSRVIR